MPRVKDSEVNRPVFTVDEVVHIISRAKEVCSERELAFLAAASVYGLRREQDKIDRSIFEVHPFLSAWSGNA